MSKQVEELVAQIGKHNDHDLCGIGDFIDGNCKWFPVRALKSLVAQRDMLLIAAKDALERFETDDSSAYATISLLQQAIESVEGE